MRLKNKRSKQILKKINNQGVTLVELIIAVAILGIVVTPLLHAFITSARINEKARNTFEETALAENLMEEFNDATVEEMITKYSGTTFADGRVEFLDMEQTLLSSDIDPDVHVDISLDPTTYTTENNINLVDLETITSSDSAIYSMIEGYDEEIYSIFESNSSSANATSPSIYTFQDKEFFEANLDRTIYLSILKTGETSEGIPLVRVEMSMVYEWLGAGSYLEAEDRRYTTKTKELFDNSSTEIPLNAIYLMFMPRYEASKAGHLDNIKILNFSNVPATAFIVRQVTTEDAVSLPEYKTRKSAHVTVIEDNQNTPYTVDTESQIQLRTNMHEELLDTHSESNAADLNCVVAYHNQTGSQIANAEISEEILKVSSLDGRTLDNTSLRNRIYEMKIELYREEMVSGSMQRIVLSTMSGTKIE
jgi:prepilin-type N-terminal cleavage/methylation domain-containing protein